MFRTATDDAGANAPDPVLRLRNLAFAWKRGRDVLRIGAFDVLPGERVFLSGPSGSGKSTLLALLGGVTRPRAGEVTVLATRLDRLSGAARDRFRADHLGIIFQMFNLVPYLSLVDNVTLPCRFSARRRAAAGAQGHTLEDEAGRLLARLGLEEAVRRNQPVTELSVGQQQRVAAARALIGRPELVIADEPTSSLDMDARGRFLDLLVEECGRAGSTLLFVSHDRSLAARFDRRVALPDINHPDAETGGPAPARGEGAP